MWENWSSWWQQNNHGDVLLPVGNVIFSLFHVLTHTRRAVLHVPCRPLLPLLMTSPNTSSNSMSCLIKNYSKTVCSHLWLGNTSNTSKACSGLTDKLLDSCLTFSKLQLCNIRVVILHHLYHPQFCLPMTVLSVILLPGCSRAAKTEMPREQAVALPLIQAEVCVPGRGCWYTWQCPAEQPHSHFSREAF